MRIGWLSASPTATTGYGTETLEVCDRLMDHHEVTCIGQTGDLLVWGGRQEVYTPSGKKLKVVALGELQSAGDLINSYYIPEFGFDVIIGFMDAFGIEFLNEAKCPVIGWIPIDGPFTQKWKHHLRDYHQIIAYSKFGYAELQKWFRPNSIGYIPHGISEEFRPMDKGEAREWLKGQAGVPEDVTLYVNVGANIGPRKELPLMMLTFSRFVRKMEAEGLKPPHLYMHTNAHQMWPKGYDLISWRRMIGMEEYIQFPIYNPIMKPATNEDLNKVYNAADVYWQNSVAEGFGLPEYEALGAGTPVIAPDNSAQTEIIEGNGPKRGWLVECLPEDVYVQIPVYVPQLPTYPVPNQRSAMAALEESYHDPNLRERYGRAGREFVLKHHNWDKVMSGWFTVLDRLQEELGMLRRLAQAFTTQPDRQPMQNV
jgi:glycosyltransferase involved in cell wall biosynthesis